MKEYKELTVGELRKELEGVPDELPVKLSSDTGVDQGIDDGEIIVEKAGRVTYESKTWGVIDYFEIYANEREIDEEEDEDEDY